MFGFTRQSSASFVYAFVHCDVTRFSQQPVLSWSSLDGEYSPRARRFPWWSWFPYEISRRLIFSQLIKKTRFTSIEDGQNRYVCCKLRVGNKYLTHESWLSRRQPLRVDPTGGLGLILARTHSTYVPRLWVLGIQACRGFGMRVPIAP